MELVVLVPCRRLNECTDAPADANDRSVGSRSPAPWPSDPSGPVAFCSWFMTCKEEANRDRSVDVGCVADEDEAPPAEGSAPPTQGTSSATSALERIPGAIATGEAFEDGIVRC